MDYDKTRPSRALSSTPAQKRKLGDTDFEIADSDDEDYGWDDDDELPPMPSQWQGSEDILLGPKLESDHEDQDNEDEAAGFQDGGDQAVDDDVEPPESCDAGGPGRGSLSPE